MFRAITKKENQKINMEAVYKKFSVKNLYHLPVEK